MSEQLSEKEQFLLNEIRRNPYITQQELANSLNVSRPTVANMISGLIKKGKIIGRAYVIAENEPIVCIGGANIDRKSYLKEMVRIGTSNPTKTTQSAGGVARNIAENLGRLGMDVSLITCSGEDADWNYIKEVSSPYMNLDQVTQITDESTGSYTAVLDSTGEMVIALADMEIYEAITPELLDKQDALLRRAKCIIADLNIPKSTLEYLCDFAKREEKPLILIPVSSPKMKRLPSDLSCVTWLIANRDETEAYFNKDIRGHESWKQAVEKWLSLGIKNVVITKGKEGAMIGNQYEIIHIPAIVSEKIVDVTGAGDAFSSAAIYAWLEGKELKEIGETATVNASKTSQSPYTVRPELSAIQLQQDMEEIK